MTSSTNLQNELLERHGIESVDVEFEVERVKRESYHRCGHVLEVIPFRWTDDEGDLVDDEVAEKRLEDLVAEKGYEETELFIYEQFEDMLERQAMEDGPGLEADAYSAYQDREYHRRKVDPNYSVR